ncbi:MULTISPECIES: hypothetical protein [unclassified Roseivivax]|uniref:hypothetical protein n=1 Tax=Roseivivax sp. GX 12232 TaxID=2900547 RepID=UPI001E5650C1|nr:hypothetical protein [Roseivivax sp. GX 12232]MCE0505281.1 hypothetical protein [Roseivivax sp. GX 12232]
MSKRLVLWLNAPHAAWLDPADTPLALGALAVDAARKSLPRDMLKGPELDTIFARRFDLTRREASEMRAACEAVAAAVSSGERLSQLIVAHVPEGERRLLADCMTEELSRHPAGSPAVLRTLSARFGLEAVPTHSL